MAKRKRKNRSLVDRKDGSGQSAVLPDVGRMDDT